MTRLTKPVTRLSDVMFRDRGKLKPLVITLHENGTIGTRLHGCRHETIVSISAVHSLGIKQEVAALQAEKSKGKKRKSKRVMLSR